MVNETLKPPALTESTRLASGFSIARTKFCGADRANAYCAPHRKASDFD
jgi:hypothetical protein